MRRAIRIDGLDKEIEIGKFVVVNAQKKQFFYLEELKDGKFRLTVTKDLIPDMSKVKGLTIIREDDQIMHEMCKTCPGSSDEDYDYENQECSWSDGDHCPRYLNGEFI